MNCPCFLGEGYSICEISLCIRNFFVVHFLESPWWLVPYVVEQEYSLPSASLAVLVGIFSNGRKIPFFPPQFVSEMQPKRLPCDLGHTSASGRFGRVPLAALSPRGRLLTVGTSLYGTPSPCPESLTLLDILIMYWVKIARIRQFHRTDHEDKNWSKVSHIIRNRLVPIFYSCE